MFAFWTLADEPEAVVCYRRVGNLQDLLFHDWVFLKSASNCNSLVSRLCNLSWPAAPCNGFQWCQRHDRRCRCRTSRSSRGVETMQKPWFQEGWIFRQNFDGENEIVIIDLTTTNKKNQHKYLNRVDLMNNSGTISLWLPSSIQRRPGQRSCNLSMFGIYISILVFRILGIYISIWYFWYLHI